MMFFMNKKSTSKPPSFLLGSHHEMKPISSFPQNSQPTTLLCVSGDDNDKDGSATKSINVDDKDATASSPPATCVVEGLVDQISHVIHSSTPTAPRSTLRRARPSYLSKLWPSSDQIVSRKPCSDTSSQPHSSKCSKPNYSDYALTCCANVLVTADNRGWRECGAHVVLDFDEQEGARLCVQFFRETKYFYRANQVMQPGSTNRYNHAMMWRGGRDWSLEFTERNQWFIFKEMYVECYNRNMRAASVKNIPTPGVLIVEGDNMVGFRRPFVRGLGYIRQVGSDIDVALDPSRVIYEMDSEDEEWVLGFNGERELTEDLFERIMDKCEKLSYVNNCTEFTKEQIEELMEDVGPMEVVKEVAGYWITKRMKKGMSLIRHLLPPLWMHYQKLLDEWEASVRKIKRAPHSALSKAPPAEKPPMFAFCLRPLSLQLECPQKKLLPSSRSHVGSRKSGRRLSARASRDRVASVSRLNHPKRTGVPASQFSDNHQAVSYLSHNQTVLTGKRKRPASFDMPDRMNPTSLPSDNLGFLKEDVEEFEARDAQNAALHAVNMARLKRQKTQLLMQKADLASSDMPDRMNPTSLPSDNLGFLKEDVEEFKVRDAQNAALHAANMARLKREKAQLLMQKADLAMYKARYSLMIVDAIKSSKG
ncbi:Enhancer of polycomb-like protein [Carex littledalei]|uniref:Enhancer of polycomb-like protein n=1 Tax=Carex littledalei TaxID=544730 RepID=A0A833QYK6_9POAL|nr:Enhancer of polycomb-like protein [Carex littledalei]